MNRAAFCLVQACMGWTLVGCLASTTQEKPDSSGHDHSHGHSHDSNVSDSCAAVLGDRAEAHACLHAEFGPFVNAVGVPLGLQPPDISASQKAFVIDASVGGLVSYVPARSGAHAIVFGPAGDLRVSNGIGRELPLRDLTPQACTMVESGYIAELVSGERYTLTFDRGTDPIVGFVEHPGSFGQEGLAESCQ